MVKPYTGKLHKLAEFPAIKVCYTGQVMQNGDKASEPTLSIYPRIGVASHNNPRALYNVLGAFTMFTKTSKMRAPSWSLPAGSPALGGTCVAAGMDVIVEDDALFICHGCYAVGGNYIYPTKQINMAIKRHITAVSVRDGNFAAMMSQSIKDYRSWTSPSARAPLSPASVVSVPPSTAFEISKLQFSISCG